ncbi:MAG: hypothetical protein CR960_02300, partial [Pasteurellales bacterium]
IGKVDDKAEQNIKDIAKNAGDIIALGNKTIKLKGDTGASTDKQKLADNIEFDIKGGEGLETIASGSQVIVDLDDKTKASLKKADKASEDIANKGLRLADADGGQSDEKKLGEQFAIVGDTNITTDANTNGIQVKLNKDITVDSVTAKTANISEGLTVASGATVDMGNNQITKVASGGELKADNTNAANIGDLFAVKEALTDSVKKSAWTIAGNGSDVGGVNKDEEVSFNNGNATTATVAAAGDNFTVKYDVNTDTDTITVKNNQLTLGDKAKADIAKGVAADTAVKDTGITFVDDNNDEITRKLGDKISIIGGLADKEATADSNIRVDLDATKDDKKLVIKMAKNLKGLESVV